SIPVLPAGPPAPPGRLQRVRNKMMWARIAAAREREENPMAKRSIVRLMLCGAIVATAIGLAASSVKAAKATLTVYTAVEADDLKKYAARFNEDHPDIEIKWVRDSTGVITAKLLAEKANPQADVVWGV